MAIIEELWILQQHYDLLHRIERNLKEPASLEKIMRLGSLLKDTEERLEELQNRIETSEKNLRKNNMLLRELEDQLKDIEKNLYEENIRDIKQLTLLDKERESISKDIEYLEIDLLKSMELIDRLRKEYDDLSQTFNGHRKEYTRLVKEHRSLMKKYEDKAKAERKEIERLMSNIDGELLKRFDDLLRTKKTAVAEVVGDRCSGCNMVLPAITLDRLKKSEEVLQCENCHRILYLP